MTDDQKVVLVEYVGKVSDEDLRYIGVRLHERYYEDLSQAIDLFSRNDRVDKILSSVISSSTFY